MSYLSSEQHAKRLKRKDFDRIESLTTNGHIRYYFKIKPPSKPGRTLGTRKVEEVDPYFPDNPWMWFETLDKTTGKIMQIGIHFPSDKKHKDESKSHLLINPETEQIVKFWNELYDENDHKIRNHYRIDYETGKIVEIWSERYDPATKTWSKIS